MAVTLFFRLRPGMFVLRSLSLMAELLFFLGTPCFGAVEEAPVTTGCAIIDGWGAVLRRKSMSDSSSRLGFKVATSSISSSLSSIAYGSRTLRCFRFGIPSWAVDCDADDAGDGTVRVPLVAAPRCTFFDLSRSAVCEFTEECIDCETVELSCMLASELLPSRSLAVEDARPFKSSESLVVRKGATVREMR